MGIVWVQTRLALLSSCARLLVLVIGGQDPTRQRKDTQLVVLISFTSDDTRLTFRLIRVPL